MASALGLLDLPLVVVLLIFDQLTRDDINIFRLVSRTARNASEPVFFRRLFFHEATRDAGIVNEALCKRLCDAEDRLGQHVRHLGVSVTNCDADALLPCDEKVLARVIESIKDLRDFSWNTPRNIIPDAVLTALHSAQPSARLHMVLPYNESELSQSHCAQWVQAMDWRQLRTLDLSHGCPEFLLAAITGHVPGLTSLRFGFWARWSGRRSWRCGDVSVVARFLESVEALEELVCRNYGQEEMDALVRGTDAITAYCRALRKLSVSFEYGSFEYRARGWTAEDIRSVVAGCPGLRDVDVQVVMEESDDRGFSSQDWPQAAISELAKLQQLEHLTVTLLVNELCHEFIVHQEHLMERAAEQRAIGLFRQLRERHSALPIQSVAVNFKISFPQRNWKFTVERRHGDGFAVSKDFVGMPSSQMEVRNPLGGTFDPWG